MPGRKPTNRLPNPNCRPSSNGRLQAAGLVLSATPAGAGFVATGLQLALAGITSKVIPTALLPDKIGVFFEKPPALAQTVDRTKKHRATIAGLVGVQNLQGGPVW